ncbi:MAG: hypothetical protein ABIC04_08630 [Nanoarchaeota archaeon]
MIKIKLFLLLFLILFCTSVSAYYTVELGNYHTTTETITPNEFKAHKGAYNICIGEPKIIPVWIKNKVSVGQFSFKTDNSDSMIIQGNGFTLNPGQEGVQFLILKPLAEGNQTYNLDIYINSQLSLRLPIKVVADNCYDVSVEIKQRKQDICGCGQYTYDAIIKNNGKSDELYHVFLDAPAFVNFGEKFAQDLNKSVTTTDQTIMIKAGAEANLQIGAAPLCEETGVYNVRLIAELERSSSIADYGELELNVVSKEDCSKPQIEVSDVRSGYERYYHPVSIQNYGIEKAEYSIYLEGPEWVSLQEDKLVLSPRQRKILYLGFDPTTENSEGKYEVKIVLAANDVEYTDTFIINLKERNNTAEIVLQFFNYYQYYVYLAAIVLFLIISFISLFKWRSKSKNIKKAEEIITKKQKPINKFMLFLITVIPLIAAAAYYHNKTLSFFNFYRFYILTIFGCIIIVLVVYLYRRRNNKPKDAKLTQQANRKQFLSYLYIIVSILALLSLAGYSIYQFFEEIRSFVIQNIFPILVIAGAIIALVVVLIVLKKVVWTSKKRNKISSLDMFKKVVKVIGIVAIIAGIVYAIVFFDIMKVLVDFIVLYLYYIFTGIVVLIIIILFFRYAKKVIEFFFEEEK